ncbi:DUF2147 domain-containing protein [Polymorphum gilvum]|uniref:DUF2147 domain-containing protein n=1 Tax=Polymorphum gilvum (strain LMG 25793 / CGMCC 1.9160 / SL003B-26A1) TaxID=991905 RepID=F2J3J9_POLGS|nr:DUF2147 domain-containing protein [Polymorphum gilvum]ADZ71023.1 hypothetical protein SL003B_2600 [Polymorphum gilvum SL003B-26A1]
MSMTAAGISSALALALALALGLGVLVASAATPARAAPDIAGDWLTPEGAVVRIEACGGAPCGRLVRFRPPPGLTMETTRDANNRDASKRARKVLGLTVLWQLAPAGDIWRGRTYDPRRGFSAVATLTAADRGRLTVRGCVRVLVELCESETWTRLR